jgi:hypothetical protein
VTLCPFGVLLPTGDEFEEVRYAEDGWAHAVVRFFVERRSWLLMSGSWSDSACTS